MPSEVRIGIVDNKEQQLQVSSSVPSQLTRTLVIALGATLLLLVNPVSAAADVGPCSDLQVYSFAANYDAATPPVTGYYSHLDPQGLFLCTAPDADDVRGSFAWSAVTGPGGCSFCIVQVGIGACDDPGNPTHCAGTSQRLFTAWGRSPSAQGCGSQSEVSPTPFSLWPAPTGAGLHYYRVWRNNSYWFWDHWPKGQALVQLQFLNQSNICWGDRHAVTFNETFNTGDSLGGTPANHYNFLSMTRQNTVGGAWSATVLNPAAPCDILSAGAIYHCDITASQNWEAWTDR